jgi:hypothetical protein
MEYVMKVLYPRIEALGGNSYRLFEDYFYEWEKDKINYKLIIPKGFICDLASIPRLLWIIISPFDLGAAAVPHDWIYSFAGRIPSKSCLKKNNNVWIEIEEPWSRKDTDRLFARMMRESNVSKFKRRSAFIAVRIFGSWVWFNNYLTWQKGRKNSTEES